VLLLLRVRGPPAAQALHPSSQPPHVVQEDRKLLAGLQQAVAAKEQQGSSQPFSLPDALAALHLAVSYRLSLKQALEKSLIGVRARLKGANKAAGGACAAGDAAHGCGASVDCALLQLSLAVPRSSSRKSCLCFGLYCAWHPHAPPPPASCDAAELS